MGEEDPEGERAIAEGGCGEEDKRAAEGDADDCEREARRAAGNREEEDESVVREL